MVFHLVPVVWFSCFFDGDPVCSLPSSVSVWYKSLRSGCVRNINSLFSSWPSGLLSGLPSWKFRVCVGLFGTKHFFNFFLPPFFIEIRYRQWWCSCGRGRWQEIQIRSGMGTGRRFHLETFTCKLLSVFVTSGCSSPFFLIFPSFLCFPLHIVCFLIFVEF